MLTLTPIYQSIKDESHKRKFSKVTNGQYLDYITYLKDMKKKSENRAEYQTEIDRVRAILKVRKYAEKLKTK